jgi:pseudouridine synthase
VTSRRAAEEWIRHGRVRVNGEVVRAMGLKIDLDTDRVEVDGSPLPEARKPVVILLNKPAGFVTTVRDPYADRTVMELLAGLDRRVYPVGRLDQATRGVLLLTDDGELANRLLHPREGIEKVYQVTVGRNLDERSLKRLAAGLELEDGPTAPARVWRVSRREGKTRFRISLTEGRKRQVRRMVRAVGGRVEDLERVSFAGITANDVAEGTWRFLRASEVRQLRSRAEGRRSPAATRVRAPRTPRPRGTRT